SAPPSHPAGRQSTSGRGRHFAAPASPVELPPGTDRHVPALQPAPGRRRRGPGDGPGGPGDRRSTRAARGLHTTRVPAYISPGLSLAWPGVGTDPETDLAAHRRARSLPRIRAAHRGRDTPRGPPAPPPPGLCPDTPGPTAARSAPTAPAAPRPASAPPAARARSADPAPPSRSSSVRAPVSPPGSDTAPPSPV